MLKVLFRFLTKFLALFFLILALYLVLKEIHLLTWKKIIIQIKTLPLTTLFLALFFVFADYLAFSGYDFLALEYIGAKIRKWLVVKTSFIGFSLTNTTGHAYLAGGSVRYFFYSKIGLTQFQILKMIAFESLTYLIGVGIVLDTCLLVSHFMHFTKLETDERYLVFLAIVISLILIFYMCLPAKRLLFCHIKLPSFKLKIKQMLVGFCDSLATSFVFYVLFLAHLNGNYFYVASIFLLAQVVGIVSQVPGGLGVFEATFLYLYPHTQSEKLGLMAVLISFRILYYFVPLIISCTVLSLDFAKRRILKFIK